MQFFVICASIFVAANALDKDTINELKTQLKKNVEACATEVKASADDVAAIMSHNMPTSHEGKCIFFCMHKVFNAQNDDGTLNMPGALESIEMLKDLDEDFHGKIVSIFKGCESTPFDSDPCVFATNMVMCLKKAGEAMGLEEMLIE